MAYRECVQEGLWHVIGHAPQLLFVFFVVVVERLEFLGRVVQLVLLHRLEGDLVEVKDALGV